MGLWFIRIRIPTVQVHVEADRRLAFQVLTAWGVTGPRGEPTSKVLEKSGDRVLCELGNRAVELVRSGAAIL